MAEGQATICWASFARLREEALGAPLATGSEVDAVCFEATALDRFRAGGYIS